MRMMQLTPPDQTLAQTLPVRVVRRLTEALVAFFVAAYASIICVQVFYRYALNDSLVWSEEVVRYGLLWGVMLGAALASDRGAHIALEPLKNSLSPQSYRVLQWLAGALIIAFCAVVAWYGWQYTSRLWRMSSPAMQMPMWYVFISIPVGCVLVSFFTLIHLMSGSFAATDTSMQGPAK